MYISMSGNAKNAFLNGDKQYCHMASSDGTTYDIDEDRIIQGSMSINSYVTTNESISFGSCVASEMSCVLNNYDGHFNNIDLMGMEFLVSFGVSVPLGITTTIEYVPIGYYIVDEVTVGKNTITISALDRMVKFDVPVNASALTFPCTTSELVTAICTACGVTCSTTLSGLPNASLTLIGAMPEETKTYRDLLHWACEIMGVNAFMSRNGMLSFKWYTKASSSIILSPSPITVANRTQSTIDTTEYEITGVTIIADNVKTSAGTTVRPIIIQDNPLIVSTDYQTVANALNTAVNGTTYHPFTAVMLPNPEYDCMDIVKFTKDGTDYWTQITEITYKLNGNSAMACGGDQQVKGRSYGLQDATLYAGNIAAGAITTDKLAAGAVHADNIAVGAVTSDAINSSVDMATNAGVASTYATQADAIKREQKIYRRTTSTTAPTTPTSWVTSTSEVNNAWTTKPIAYNSTYKYLWVSIQRETVSGTRTCTTPVRDSTITVIDGGNIITGTVTADQIYVTDLETLDATIGGWTINETNIASSGNAVVLNSSGTINVTETGTTAEGAKLIAETSNNKAYYSAYGVRAEVPPNIGTNGDGTVTIVDQDGFACSTRANNATVRSISAINSGSVSLSLRENSSALGDWENKQTAESILITHKTSGTTDQSYAYGSGGVVQSVDDNNVRYEAGISPKASTPSGVAARMLVKQDNSLITVDAYNTEARISVTDGSNTAKLYCDNDEPQLRLDDTHRNTQKLYRGRLYNMYYNGSNTTNYIMIDEGLVSICKGTGDLRDQYPTSAANVLSQLGPDRLKVNTHDLLRMSPHFAQMFATAVSANANINTTTYLKVGQYVCSSYQTAITISNIPQADVFTMTVETPISSTYDDESTTSYGRYRMRTIRYTNGNVWVQVCSAASGSSTWTYGAWKKIVTSADSVTELSSAGNITTSTSWFDTGKSITITSDGWWAIEAYCSYSNGAPLNIAIVKEAGNYVYEQAYTERHGVFDKTVSQVYVSHVGDYSANNVLHLWAKYNNASTNYVCIRAKKLH